MAIKRVVVLSLPTTHDVYSPLKKQYGVDLAVEVLGSKSMVELSDDGISALTKDLQSGINHLLLKYQGVDEFDLLVTGLPLANIISFMLMRDRDKNVNFLVYNTRKRRYFRVEFLGLCDQIKLLRWSR